MSKPKTVGSGRGLKFIHERLLPPPLKAWGQPAKAELPVTFSAVEDSIRHYYGANRQLVKLVERWLSGRVVKGAEFAATLDTLDQPAFRNLDAGLQRGFLELIASKPGYAPVVNRLLKVPSSHAQTSVLKTHLRHHDRSLGPSDLTRLIDATAAKNTNKLVPFAKGREGLTRALKMLRGTHVMNSVRGIPYGALVNGAWSSHTTVRFMVVDVTPDRRVFFYVWGFTGNDRALAGLYSAGPTFVAGLRHGVVASQVAASTAWVTKLTAAVTDLIADTLFPLGLIIDTARGFSVATYLANNHREISGSATQVYRGSRALLELAPLQGVSLFAIIGVVAGAGLEAAAKALGNSDLWIRKLLRMWAKKLIASVGLRGRRTRTVNRATKGSSAWLQIETYFHHRNETLARADMKRVGGEIKKRGGLEGVLLILIMLRRLATMLATGLPDAIFTDPAQMKKPRQPDEMRRKLTQLLDELLPDRSERNTAIEAVVGMYWVRGAQPAPSTLVTLAAALRAQLATIDKAVADVDAGLQGLLRHRKTLRRKANL